MLLCHRQPGRFRALSALCPALFLLAASPAFPAANRAVFGPDFGTGQPVVIKLITNYYPQMGGINGNCGQGGGTAPKDPCKHLLEDAVNGSTPCVVAATQRRGGSAPLYGCTTEVSTVSDIAGKPVNVCFADVYADKESEGSIGTNGKVQPSKFDLAVKPNSEMGRRIQSASEKGSGINVGCHGRVPNTQNRERQVQRDPEATQPEGAPASPPGGGGSPAGGSESPSQQASKPPFQDPYPGATSPTPESKLPPHPLARSPDPGAAPKSGGTTPKEISDVTKGGPQFLPPPVRSAENGRRKTAGSQEAYSPPSGASAIDPHSLGAAEAHPRSASAAKSLPEKPAPAGSDYAYKGGGGFPGGGGGGGAASAGGAASSEPAKPVALSDSPPAEAADPALPGEESRVENQGGIDAQNGPSLFERVHTYYVRRQRQGAVGGR